MVRSLPALKFGVSTDRVDCGSPAVYDNMSSWSLGVVMMSTGTTYLDWFSKDTAAGGTWFYEINVGGGAGDVQVQIAHATTELLYRTSTILSLNRWYFIGSTVNLSAGVGDRAHFYYSDLRGQMTEPSYAVKTEPVGAKSDDSANSLVLGNAANAYAFEGRMALAFVSPSTVLSLNEFQAWRQNPTKLPRGCQGFWVPGLNGLGRVRDYSGKANHGTITGAIPVEGVHVGARKKHGAFKVLAAIGLALGRYWHPGKGVLQAARFYKTSLSTQTSAGTLFFQSLTATLSFVGTLIHTTLKIATGGLSFAGAISKLTARPVSANLSFTGAFIKRTLRPLVAASLSFIGALVRAPQKAVAGVVSFVGALVAKSIFTKLLTATLSFVGALSRFTSYPLASTLSFTGAMTKLTTTARAATLSFTGAVTKRANKTFAGVLSFSGALGTLFGKVFTAALSFAGSVARSTLKMQSSTLSFAGVMVRRISMSLAADLSFVGALARRTAKAMTAGLSFVGVFSAKSIFTKALTAALSFIGAIRKQTGKALPGGLSFIGAFSRASRKALSASLDLAGVLVKASKRALAATLSFVGAFVGSRLILKALNATLSFAGVVRKQAGKAVVGTLSLSGILSRRIGKVLTASLTLAGMLALLPTLQQLFTAVARVGQFFSTMLSSSSAGTKLTGSETKTTVKDSKDSKV